MEGMKGGRGLTMCPVCSRRPSDDVALLITTRFFFSAYCTPLLPASVPCGFPGVVNPSPTHHPHVTILNRPSQCFSSLPPNARLRSCHITHKGVFQSGEPLGGLMRCFFWQAAENLLGFLGWGGGMRGLYILSNIQQQNVLSCDTGVIFNTTHRYSMLA